MIARLRGKVIEHEQSIIIVECAGIGYGVHVCHDEQSKLAVGSHCDLFIVLPASRGRCCLIY